MINTSNDSVSQEFNERPCVFAMRQRPSEALKVSFKNVNLEMREFDVLSFELKHYKDFEESQNRYVEYEIDSIKEDFGEIFRLWNGRTLIGTFYKTSQGWKAEPFYLCKQYIRAEINLSKSVDSSEKAIAHIKQMYEGTNSDRHFIAAQTYKSVADDVAGFLFSYSNFFNKTMDKYLSIEFRLQKEERYLKKNPSIAITLALNYLEDFLNLAREFRALEKKYQSVMADNQRLTSQLIEISSSTGDKKYLISKRSISRSRVRIPHFLNCQKH
jgi:hypothetical protein